MGGPKHTVLLSLSLRPPGPDKRPPGGCSPMAGHKPTESLLLGPCKAPKPPRNHCKTFPDALLSLVTKFSHHFLSQGFRCVPKAGFGVHLRALASQPPPPERGLLRAPGHALTCCSVGGPRGPQKAKRVCGPPVDGLGARKPLFWGGLRRIPNPSRTDSKTTPQPIRKPSPPKLPLQNHPQTRTTKPGGSVARNLEVTLRPQ